LRLLSARFPDSWPDWSERSASRRFLPRGCLESIRAYALLVHANTALVQQQFARASSPVLGRHDCSNSTYAESLAARHALCLLRCVLVFRFGGSRFFRLSVRWHAAFRRIYFPVFRAARPTSTAGRSLASVAR